MSHDREARILCRKSLDWFALLSRTQETGSRRAPISREHLALVAGLPHYLHVLIRIALTGALKLEREHGVREAMQSFLDKLHYLAIQCGNPSAPRMMLNGAKGGVLSHHSPGNPSTNGVLYGFRSLASENAGESPSLGTLGAWIDDSRLSGVPVTIPPSPKCPKCKLVVEEDCVRLGVYQRWHSRCIRCKSCGSVAAANDGSPRTRAATTRHPPANVDFFAYDQGSIVYTQPFGAVPTVMFCTDHAHHGCRRGFQAVSRLEQYTYLLNLGLRELYAHLKTCGLITDMPSPGVCPILFMVDRELKLYTTPCPQELPLRPLANPDCESQDLVPASNHQIQTAGCPCQMMTRLPSRYKYGQERLGSHVTELPNHLFS